MEVSTTQAAALLGKSERTIQRWITQEKLHARRMADGHYLVNVADLEAIAGEQIDLEAILARLDDLESRVQGILDGYPELKRRVSDLERIVEGLAMSPAPLSRRVSSPHPASPGAQGELLPVGYTVLKDFYHGISRSTALRRVEHLAKRGQWIHEGHEVLLALDAPGRALAYEALRSHPQFQACSDCPHAEQVSEQS